jgi:hypothetical protein
VGIFPGIELRNAGAEQFLDILAGWMLLVAGIAVILAVVFAGLKVPTSGFVG